MIRRERIERQLVDYVFHDMFTPLKLEFLDQVIEPIFAQHTQAPDEVVRLRESELAWLSGELEHVKEAIRQGILTPTTRTMLEEAERRMAETSRWLGSAPSVCRPVGRLGLSSWYVLAWYGQPRAPYPVHSGDDDGVIRNRRCWRRSSRNVLKVDEVLGYIGAGSSVCR